MQTSRLEDIMDAVAAMAATLRARGFDPDLVRTIERETIYRLTELTAERLLDEPDPISE